MEKVIIRASRIHYHPGGPLGLYIQRDQDQGLGMSVATEIIFRAVKEDERHLEISPVIGVNVEKCQVLMDDLWMAGLRPSEGSGSAGQLAATQKHLNDMRILVAGKKEMLIK